MAYKKTTTNQTTYFKPDIRIEYKPSKAGFEGYRFSTKEKLEFSKLEFISIVNLHKYESEDFTSNLYENLFTDKLHLRDKEFYKYIGTYRFDSTIKGLVDLKGHDAHLQGQSTLCCIGLLGQETIMLEIKGAAKMDISVVKHDRTNKDKVATFKNSTILSLVPSDDVTVVGSGSKKKKIFLLEVKSLDDTVKLNSEQLQRMDEIVKIIETELQNSQKIRGEFNPDVHPEETFDIDEDFVASSPEVEA